MTTELAARGLRIAAGGAHLAIGRQRFYENTVRTVFGVKTIAVVTFDAEVRSPSGSKFKRVYSDTVAESYSWDFPANAVDRLDKAFGNAAQKAASDPDLQAALETAHAG